MNLIENGNFRGDLSAQDDMNIRYISLIRKIFISTALVSFAIFIGRLAGLVREVLLASTLGISKEADMAVLMLTFPDFLLNIIVGGAMAAVLVPTFKRLNRTEAVSFFSQMNFVIAILFSIFTLILFLKPEILISIFAPGFDTTEMQIIFPYLRIVVWILPFTAFAGVSTAFLQANERFFIPALGTLLFNGIVIAGLFIGRNQNMILISLAVSIVLAGFIRWLSQLWNIKTFSPLLSLSKSPFLNKKLLIGYFESVFALGIPLLIPVIAGAFATLSTEGGLALLNYSNKLIQLPLGIFLTVFSITLFPKFSELLSKHEEFMKAKTLIRSSLWLVFSLSIILMLIFISFRSPIVRLIYDHGHVTLNDIATLTELTGIGFLVLPAMGLSSLLITIYNAKLDTRTPLIINLIMLLGFILSAWILSNYYGLTGIVVAQVVSSWLGMLLQIIMLRYSHGVLFSPNKRVFKRA
ncbi:MAG: hypothetical protein JSS53_00390 [Proteobacteria bacterium]|nr:hypothetical protein [Pseudomonadota bacterium]